MINLTKEELQKENEEKKEYLRSHQGLVKRIKIIQMEIEELRTAKMNPSVTYSDMPCAGGNSDLSTYMAELDNKEQYLIETKEQCTLRYNEILEKIEKMDDDIEKSLLTLKYLRGLTFDEVSEKLNYSRRNIITIHGKALKNFII